MPKVCSERLDRDRWVSEEKKGKVPSGTNEKEKERDTKTQRKTKIQSKRLN